MIVAISRFRVPPDEAEQIAQRFTARSRRVDSHAGFLGLEVLRAPGREHEFLLVTRWDTKESLKAYMRSDDFRAVHKDGEEQDADFRMYEQVTT